MKVSLINSTFNSDSLKIGLGLGLEDDEEMTCLDEREKMHIVEW